MTQRKGMVRKTSMNTLKEFKICGICQTDPKNHVGSDSLARGLSCTNRKLGNGCSSLKYR